MNRLELLSRDSAPMLARQHFANGDPGPIVAALATVPELINPVLGFVGAALGPGAVSTRHKEFAILRTSALLGCDYCIQAHSAVARDVGLTPAEVRGLRGEVSLDDVFSDAADRALLTWIDAMAGAGGQVPDDVWTAARLHFDDYLLVELSVTIGATMFLNRFATCFQLPTSADVRDRLKAEDLLWSM